LSGVRAQLAIKLFGPDLAVLAEQGIDGTRDVAMEQIAGEAQLVIRPERERLSRFGLAVGDVMAVVRDGLGGSAAGQIINGNERYDIYVRLAQPFRTDPEAIANLRLQSPTGPWVRLGDVAKISIESGPPQVRRDDVQRRVVIQANVEGRAFNSVGQAMLILVNVPLAVIGGIFSLYISGQYLSVPSSIGFITLFGVAVLNGVVMVESINQRIADGLSVGEAVFSGATSRLRPVLMTAITSALGLIPMLLSTGVGAEIQKPLATVIVGGLLTATFLTLFVLPSLFTWFSRGKLADMR